MKIVAVFVLAFAGPAFAADDAQQRLDARAEACISAGAPAVVRIEPNLTAAVDFLANDLCAREIEIAQKYGVNRRLLDSEIDTEKASIEFARKASCGSVSTAPPLQIRPVRPSAPGTSAPASAVAASNAAVAAQRAADAHQQLVGSQQERLAKLEAARVDPETGELIGSPSETNSSGMEFLQAILSPRMAQAPASFRAFAARAVLAAREATR